MNRNNKPVNAFLVNPSKVAFALGTIALILVIASLVGQLMTYVLCEDFVSKHSHVKGLIKHFHFAFFCYHPYFYFLSLNWRKGKETPK